MAKKFDVNVASNWISTDISNSSGADTSEKSAEEKKTVKKTVTKKAEESAETEEVKTSVKESSSSKKTKAEAAFTIVGKELKKRQTSLLLKESTYAKLEELSKKNGISVNSCINQILEQVLS